MKLDKLQTLGPSNTCKEDARFHTICHYFFKKKKTVHVFIHFLILLNNFKKEIEKKRKIDLLLLIGINRDKIISL